MNTPQFKPTPSVPWLVVYRGSGDTTDGIVESPYLMANFDADFMYWPVTLEEDPAGSPATITQDAPYPSGNERLFLPENSEMQLLPLFTTDSANAVVQLWGFDVFARARGKDIDVADPEPRYLLNPNRSKSSYILGEAYNMAREDPGHPRTLAFVAQEEVQTLGPSVAVGSQVYRDGNGESFAVGLMHRFRVGDRKAFMVNVPSVSAGELVVLARFVPPRETF